MITSFEDLEDNEFGILGQNGFFTEFSWICFNLKNRVFTVNAGSLIGAADSSIEPAPSS
jgi:hypothetical protein